MRFRDNRENKIEARSGRVSTGGTCQLCCKRDQGRTAWSPLVLEGRVPRSVCGADECCASARRAAPVRKSSAHRAFGRSPGDRRGPRRGGEAARHLGGAGSSARTARGIVVAGCPSRGRRLRSQHPDRAASCRHFSRQRSRRSSAFAVALARECEHDAPKIHGEWRAVGRNGDALSKLPIASPATSLQLLNALAASRSHSHCSKVAAGIAAP